jgi:hypothetical protein
LAVWPCTGGIMARVRKALGRCVPWAVVAVGLWACGGEADSPDLDYTGSEGAICQKAGTPDGTSCDDGDPCTANDLCQLGTCAGKMQDGLPCDDGEPCTFYDSCLAGKCQGEKVGVLFGGKSPDEANAVVAMADGGVAFAGYTQTGTDGWGDLWIVRTDPLGNPLWTRIYGGHFFEAANAMVQQPDGGLVLAGYTNAQEWNVGSDLWIVGLDAKGEQKWKRTYGGPESDHAAAMVRLADGGLAIAGFTESWGAGKGDAWLVRTTIDGKKMWDRPYGGAEYDAARAVAAVPGGDIVLAGQTFSSGAGASDGWYAKVDAQGQLLWQKTAGGKNDDLFRAVAVLPDGGLALAGVTRSTGAGEEDAWLVRTDADGGVLWQRAFGSKQNDGALALAVLPTGGFALAGYRDSQLNEGAESWLLRTDDTGEVVADQSYGVTETGIYIANAVALLPKGGFALAGRMQLHGVSQSDALLVLTDSTGKSTCD